MSDEIRYVTRNLTRSDDGEVPYLVVRRSGRFEARFNDGSTVSCDSLEALAQDLSMDAKAIADSCKAKVTFYRRSSAAVRRSQ